MISISNPAIATTIFTALLVVCLVLSIRKKTGSKLFPPELTEELKGLAILMVVFGHIGYFLSSSDRFLWPLSTMAGVGVNLFLFLSGYGLSISSIKKPDARKVHLTRIIKLFIPLWIVVVVYFLLDYFVLHIGYSRTYIFHSFAGFFPNADVVHDVNSVLWYFSLILFYYLLYPVVFIRRHLWFSALILIAILTIIVRLNPSPLHDVLRLYRVHTLAFPLGMILAWFVNSKASQPFKKLRLLQKKHTNNKLAVTAVYALILVVLGGLVGYTAIHSSVGSTPIKEQLTSLVSMFAVILFFMIKRFRFALLSLFGFVSYEIYLIHWPLLSRYDFLYSWLPSWLATLLYGVVFIALGWILKLIANSVYSIRLEKKT